ncbi:ABC transporter permease [freshwater metagenome]|uniref:ABC transporter permease n=1 Tax=freshwater metagenome TaxID=449393 RepID=A0A094PWC4_9ZZZZ
MSTETKKETRESWKTPTVMGSLAAVVLVFFGILGKPESVAFELTGVREAVQLPNIDVPSNVLGIASGILLLAIAGFVAWQVAKNIRSSIWLSIVFGAIALVALLGWLAGGQVVPVAFILGSALVLAVPIMLGAMAGVMSERVGVVNIAIEGQLLTGAFVASVVSTLTGNQIIGIISAMITAALFSAVLAVFAVRFLAQQIIVGVVLNVLAIGITNFLYQQWVTEDESATNSPGTLPIIHIPFLGDIPVIGPVLFQNRITVWLAIAIVIVLWFVLFKTKLGLRARAVGENPLAADTVGINVGRTRFWWVTLGGLLAGLGGAALTIGSSGSFGREMSGGLGFIALAVVILGRWHPGYATAAALLFGFSIILRVWANQVSPGIPTNFITMVPYIVTIIAVVGFVGRSRPPAADGIPYVKG